MKTFLYTTLLLTLIAAACRDSNSPAVTAIIDSAARQDDVITDTKGPDTIPHMDTTMLVVNTADNMTINGTALPKNKNAVYHAVYYNWLHAYTLVRRVPATLHVSFAGAVPADARAAIIGETTRAQQDMRKYIAKHKYNTSYDALSAQQQAEIEQQYGILYQKVP